MRMFQLKIISLVTILLSCGIGILIGWKVNDNISNNKEFTFEQEPQKLSVKRNGNLWIVFKHGSNTETLGLIHHDEMIAFLSTYPSKLGIQHAVIATESDTGTKETHEILNPDVESSED